MATTGWRVVGRNCPTTGVPALVAVKVAAPCGLDLEGLDNRLPDGGQRGEFRASLRRLPRIRGHFADIRTRAGAIGREHKRAEAFTLIEMILAVGITAIVLLAVSATLFTALHLRDTTQALVDAEQPLGVTGTLLRRDLMCMMPPTTNGIFSGDFKAGQVTSPGIGQPVAMELYTATGAMSESQPWGDVQKVTYELRTPNDPTQPGKDLIRSVTRNILATATVDVDDQWLMGGVDTLHITCFDGNVWQETWDTTDTSTANTNLPFAVKIEIQLSGANNGNGRPMPIEFLVPIDSQSRTNT